MRNPSDKLRAIAEAAIRAGDPRVQFVSPQLVIGGLQELEAEIEALREAYQEAIHDIDDWASYASDYFKEKHDLAGCIADHQAKLEGSSDEGWN